MNGDYVTKQDLTAAVAQLEQGRHELRDELKEAIRDAQTELLRAFHNWARPIEGRVRRSDELAQRMSWLEDRISELEREKREGKQ